jgi:uncharacterized membrane protein YagU involved in acid resistance
MHLRKRNGDVWKGLAGGIAGGLVASFVMNQFQTFVSKMDEAAQEGKRRKKKSSQDEDATVKAASAVAENVFDHKLTADEKKIAGPAVHYAFGTLTGALYGAAAELAPATSALRGLAFGTAVWLAADEITVPALHLAKPPGEVPPSKHAYALASHFVYGLTADAVRRWVRDTL